MLERTPIWKLALLCAAAAYPAHWLVSTILALTPGLASWLTTGSLPGLELSTAGLRFEGRFGFTRQQWYGAAVALAIAWMLRRRTPWLAGLLLVMLGAALSGPPMIMYLFPRRRPIDPWFMASLPAGLASAVAGCVLLLRGLPPVSMPVRCVALAAALVPVFGVRLLAGGGFPGRFRYWELAPVAAAALLAGIRPLAGQPHPWSRNWVGAGVLLTAGLYGASSMLGGNLATRRVLAALPPVATDAPYPREFFQRGVSFTAESGVGYHTQSAREMLAQLPDWGVNAIALVPYGGASWNPPRIRTAGSGSWESDDGIRILASLAHQKGIRVLLKPHVWRPGGDQIRDDAELAQWFEQYGAFLEHYARLAAAIHADLFCVGVEFAGLTKHEQRWRDLIQRVRAIYSGPLVYAANHGDDFENVRFWDALDYIGLDNYYPMPDDYSTAELMAKVERVQQRYGKPVIFSEAGFSAVENAHRAPWEDETDKPLSLDEQARCYEALLAAFYEKPWFHGVYWWKVGTNGYGGPSNNSMTPWRKPAMDVVKKWYASGKR